MPNLFKVFCLKAKLMIFTSTKASTTTQSMHLCICKCIRMASENKISCLYKPLTKNYRKACHCFICLQKGTKTLIPSPLPHSYKTHPCGVPPLRGREPHSFHTTVFQLFLYFRSTLCLTGNGQKIISCLIMYAIHLQVPFLFSMPHTSSIKPSLNTRRPKVIYLLVLDSPKVAKLEETRLLKVKSWRSME